MLVKACCGVASLLILVAYASADELESLAGRFERTVANEAGTMFRIVKDVAGDQSTVTTYDDVGRVVMAHTSTIKVEKRGDVRVLTFFDLKVTAGPGKGSEQKGPQSYVYRLHNDIFAEAWGLLEGDTSPPRIIYWKRQKPDGR
jgi:hypothetical protein